MKEKKKILYLITKSNWGGAQRYVYDLTASLPRGHLDVVVALGGRGELKQRLDTRGIRTISIPELGRDISLWNDFISFLKILKLLYREKPHVLHCNSSKAGALGMLAARIYNLSRPTAKSDTLKAIFTVHGWAFTEDRAPLSRLMVKYIQWLTVALSHITIAVSKNTEREAYDFPFVFHKIKTIHNGIGEIKFFAREKARRELELVSKPHSGSVNSDFGLQTSVSTSKYPDIPRSPTEVFAPKYEFSARKQVLTQALTEANKISAGNIWIGVMGELHKNKGLQYAIGALEHIQDIPCTLFVIGEGEERGYLESVIQEKKLADRVFLLGYKKDASRYLKAFDIFLFPSTKEGFPYTLLEAGYAGLPVIASDVGGIPEIIEHGTTGFLTEPRDNKQIAHALQILLQNKNTRNSHGKNLKEKIEGAFSLEKMCAETFTHYY